VNASNLSHSLFENVKLFSEKIERYSPVFVYGNDADGRQNICACLECQSSKLKFM